LSPASRPDGAGGGRRPAAGVALVFIAAALWATFGPLARVLYDRGYSPVELASVRTWLGVVGALAVAAVLRAPLRIRRGDIAFFAAYGVVGFAAFETLLLASFRHITVPVAISLLYTAPVFVLLVSHYLWAERVTSAKKLALPLSIAGVLYTIFGRASVPRAHPVAAVFWSFLFAAIALTFLAPPLELLTRDAGALPWLLALGIVPTLLPYLFYLQALRTVQPGTAAMLACVEPLVAALLAAVFLGERLSAIQAIGMSLIVGAAVVLVAPARRSAS